MVKHYDVYDIENGRVVSDFELLKDAELWIAEQENPSNFEVVPIEGYNCNVPMNLFLDSSNLTRNKR